MSKVLLVFLFIFSYVLPLFAQSVDTVWVKVDNGLGEGMGDIANAHAAEKASVFGTLYDLSLLFTENQEESVDLPPYETYVRSRLVINRGNLTYAWIEVDPFEPMTQDSVLIAVLGQWIDVPRRILSHEHTILGNLIRISLYVEVDPWSSIWFDLTEQIGQLSEGEYQIEVVVYEQSVPPDIIATMGFRVFPFTPATLNWGSDSKLTDDSLSDSAPAAAMYNGEIHVLWNHSYEGEIHHGVLDCAGWQNFGYVKDCPSGSGPAVVTYGDTLYGFYPQGEYPIYHLFGKKINPSSEQFQLTTGDVYDRYGAAAIVYRDVLYVFWKRWVGSGHRNILYRIYSGQNWSDEVTIADDGYSDARPSVATYGDKLFLFYDGGKKFRTFDGSVWSSEVSSVMGTVETITPAVSTFDNSLYLLLRHGGQVYYKRFDGSTWTAARLVPTSSSDEIRDLASLTNDDVFYMFWGSYYSWSSSELYAKRAIAMNDQFTRGDANGDKKVTVSDVIYLVNYLFKGGSRPVPCESGDVNCDGKVTVSDVVYLINYLFKGGPPPAC